MSKKINLDDVMWAPNEQDTYAYEDLSNVFSTGIYGEIKPVMEIAFHPRWLEKMNGIEVGDAVMDSDGRVGLIVKDEGEDRSGIVQIAGVKRFRVSFSGEEDVQYSCALSKVEDINE
jgi:hypothetical protein